MSARHAMEALSTSIKQMIEADRQKIGGLTFGASARLGLEELRQAVALDGAVADRTQTPLGMYGTVTPGEVSAARQEAAVRSTDVEPEAVEKQAAAANDPVAAAQRQTRATNDAAPGRDSGMSR